MGLPGALELNRLQESGQPGPVLDARLIEDVFQMCLNRISADVELFPDLIIGKPLTDAPDNVALTPGELVLSRDRRLFRKFFHADEVLEG